MKKITLITATFNSSATLARCLDSVAMQSVLTGIEHIIVDGGSRDNTLDIVANYAHVAAVVSERDDGIYDAFNKGLALATGEYIYYLNSDDYLLNSAVIGQVLDALCTEDLDYLSCLVQEKNPNSGATSTPAPIELLCNERVLKKPCHQGFFVRTSMLRKLGGFPRCFKIVADTYIMLVVIISGRGQFLHFPVACFTLDGVSSDSKNKALISNELAAVYTLLNLQPRQGLDVQINQLQLTLAAVKSLFISSFDQGLNTLIVSGNVAIFGTGEMSVMITKLLRSRGVSINNYILTKPSEAMFLQQNVVSITTQIDADVVINTIEGPHFSEISAQIKQHNPHAAVLRWDQIYE
jgi:glycosyltransferase involved in cell wall biosynthesis